MIDVEFQRFSLNRILLSTIGLWPYRRTKFVRIWFILLFVILVGFIVFQLTTFMTAQVSINFVMKNLSFAFLFVTFAINYATFWVNARSVKYLLDQLQYIYNELKDENEIVILEKYEYNAKRYTINILLLTICSLIVVIAQPFWPYMLDVLPFINGSRSCCTLPIITEYFIDQEKYFYIIVLHTDIATCIGAIALIAPGTLLVVSLKQACGMFRIASYRIEQAMTKNVLKNINLEVEIFIYKKITNAIDIHRKAMHFAGTVINSFEGMFCFLIMFGVLCLSFNLFRIFQEVSFGNNIEIIINFLFGIIIVVFMFLANYAGQEIMDHNNDVYHTAYNVCWYIAPLHVQKLILFLLQRGNKTFSLTVGGLFTGSLEGFASLVSAAVSYFTVIYSTQQ